jgi:hypothetical protein
VNRSQIFWQLLTVTISSRARRHTPTQATTPTTMSISSASSSANSASASAGASSLRRRSQDRHHIHGSPLVSTALHLRLTHVRAIKSLLRAQGRSLSDVGVRVCRTAGFRRRLLSCDGVRERWRWSFLMRRVRLSCVHPCVCVCVCVDRGCVCYLSIVLDNNRNARTCRSAIGNDTRE